jgi:hypothetical protein
MKFELKSIGYWSLIKISFVVNLIAGFVAGIFFALFIGFIFSFASRMGGLGGMPLFEEGMPPIGLIMMMYPFILGFGGAIINTIMFLIVAFVYNVAAKMIGGLELEFKQLPVALSPSQPAGYYSVPPSYPTPPSPPPPPPIQPLPPEMTPPPEGPMSGS